MFSTRGWGLNSASIIVILQGPFTLKCSCVAFHKRNTEHSPEQKGLACPLQSLFEGPFKKNYRSTSLPYVFKPFYCPMILGYFCLRILEYFCLMILGALLPQSCCCKVRKLLNVLNVLTLHIDYYLLIKLYSVIHTLIWKPQWLIAQLLHWSLNIAGIYFWVLTFTGLDNSLRNWPLPDCTDIEAQYQGKAVQMRI